MALMELWILNLSISQPPSYSYSRQAKIFKAAKWSKLNGPLTYTKSGLWDSRSFWAMVIFYLPRVSPVVIGCATSELYVFYVTFNLA